MPEVTLGERVAAFAVDAAKNGVPREVVASVHQRTLDILGLCVAAHRLDTSAAAVGHVLDQGGHGQSTVVGHPTPVTALQAAFVNGVLAHSLDYDDTHLPSVLHPSASVVPAALSAAAPVAPRPCPKGCTNNDETVSAQPSPRSPRLDDENSADVTEPGTNSSATGSATAPAPKSTNSARWR